MTSNHYLEWRKDEQLNPPWVLTLVTPGRDPIQLACFEQPAEIRGGVESPAIQELRQLLEDRERKHDAFRVAETAVDEGRAERYSAEMSAFDAAHGEVLDWMNNTDHLSELLCWARTHGDEMCPQAPIARIVVHAAHPSHGPETAELVEMYAPGLPPGEHDVYCDPSAPSILRDTTSAPLTDAEAGAVFMSSGIPKLIVDGVKIGPQHWFSYARAIAVYLRSGRPGKETTQKLEPLGFRYDGGNSMGPGR